ncbi:MAG: KpsF/GutQ family sugar-phosphate isomerase [candidate division Zixibacteria bacterium]|nr:KpsF/GutQ family sugar-phosphate isomerase [candidate division Zixibacteria bacterium]
MSELTRHAAEVIRIEAEAVAALADKLNGQFDLAVDAILNCRGRVIVSGMGKSGLIGKKIAATFNSTGISSFFLHPAEAIHGDMGLIRKEDVLMLISKSGRLGESELVVAAAKRLSTPVIVLSGTPDSEMSRRANIVLDCSVAEEACPNILVPTSSSTAALVMGDALAVALLKARNFGPNDFAQLHPGGALGMRLLKRVRELHHEGDELPLAKPETTMKEMILEMTSKRLGCVAMIDKAGCVAGIFTDGDLRRVAEGGDDFYDLTAAEVMIKNPKSISADAILDSALALMEKHAITQLPTVDDQNHLVGILHLHDILKSKLV